MLNIDVNILNPSVNFNCLAIIEYINILNLEDVSYIH